MAKHCYELEANKDKRFDGWVSCLPTTDTAWHQRGTNKVEPHAAKLVTNTATYSNYWSLLACLVKAQEEDKEDTPPQIERAFSASTDNSPTNKFAAHWVQKILNRKTR